MKATSRLALWLVLAADAMFVVGLLSASRVMNREITGQQIHFDFVAVGLVCVGRLVLLRWKWVSIFLALAAAVLLSPMLQQTPGIEWLLHMVLLVHVLGLIAATLAFSAEINLTWEFVIALGCMVLASLR